MSAVGLEGIDHAVQQAYIWTNELDRRMGWDNNPRAYRLLKAVLHALRDHLQVNEAADLGAQLPTLIRGAFDPGQALGSGLAHAMPTGMAAIGP